MYMFQGFCDQTFDFLWGIRFNNNREWFQENKQNYLSYVVQPMQELTDEVFARITKQHEPGLYRHVSRIYRDARYVHGDGKYRDRMWFSLRRKSEEWTETPVFFFEIQPEGYCYGMGYYNAPARTMARFRNRIDAQPEEFERMLRTLDTEKLFTLTGDKYRRKKGSKPEPVADWYERKNLCMIAERPGGPELFSEALVQIITDGFVSLLPLYRYLWSLEPERI
jgi:uncharacterized protein (TIGR02453 family)